MEKNKKTRKYRKKTGVYNYPIQHLAQRKYGTAETFISIKNYNFINLQSNQYYYIVQEPEDLNRKNKMKLILLIIGN